MPVSPAGSSEFAEQKVNISSAVGAAVGNDAVIPGRE